MSIRCKARNVYSRRTYSFQMYLRVGGPFSNCEVVRQILDDGFKHSLIVYEDIATKGIRLHAAVWEGELRQCPVWTAFGRLNSQDAWAHRLA